jgi:deazaflavin-dependent oxidoreductase (nitroreductase family)
MTLDQSLIGEQFCYVTTTGRVTGNPHTIEIWFGHAARADGDTLYLLAGGRDRSDWVRNLLREPAVTVRIGEQTLAAHARVVDADSPEDALARRLLFDKYNPGYDSDLSGWRDSALPVAIDLA